VIDFFIKTFVRTRFALTSCDQASRQIRSLCAQYLALAEQLDPAAGSRPVRVPPMPGIDEEMRNWSFYMVLEHNTLVNRSITAIVESLARGEEPTGLGAIDPKRDVLPSARPGAEQVAVFRSAVDDHLRAVAGLAGLRGGRTKRHPIFGEFDAHRWHCMFGFHLFLHYRQAKHVVREALARHSTR
jgi:hypothetical protein